MFSLTIHKKDFKLLGVTHYKITTLERIDSSSKQTNG